MGCSLENVERARVRISIQVREVQGCKFHFQREERRGELRNPVCFVTHPEKIRISFSLQSVCVNSPTAPFKRQKETLKKTKIEIHEGVLIPLIVPDLVLNVSAGHSIDKPTD